MSTTSLLRGGSESPNPPDREARGAIGSSIRRQGTYWIGTISKEQNWSPGLLDGISYLSGQLERGESGFEHWQIFFICSRKQSIRSITRLFAPTVGHFELTRSSAAESYVCKEETRIGTPFEFGRKPFRRNSSTDWDCILSSAKNSQWDNIPADIYIRYYR